MKISVIIPVCNARLTLPTCIDSIYSSNYKDYEVIAVDDASTDGSKEILMSYPLEHLQLSENCGAAYARNRGTEKATGDIFLFIDADVVIRPDTLEKVAAAFTADPSIDAMTGLLAKESPYRDFFSSYKNLYMNYVFRHCPDRADFLYGSIMAIRRNSFLPFNEEMRITDDTELGQRYKALGKKVVLNKSLEVVHLKQYSFRLIIRNDYNVPRAWGQFFLKYGGLRDIFTKRRFAHARLSQCLGLAASFGVVGVWILPITLAYRYYGFLFFVALFFVLNGRFICFILKERGLWYALKAIVFTLFDQWVLGVGALSGLIGRRS